jgi:hypothetical protein
MAGRPVPGYHQYWTDMRASLKTAHKELLKSHPDATASMEQLFKVLCDIEDVASFTPAKVGESEEWAAIVRSAEDNRESFCQALKGKPLFNALHGTYTVSLHAMKTLLKASHKQAKADDFQEVRSRKRQSSGETTRTPKKAAVPPPAPRVETKNFFAPLRATNTSMDTDSPGADSSPADKTEGKSARPPPIMLTSVVNLIKLQKELKSVAKQSFELRNTKSGTRVVTKDMVDYQSAKSHFQTHNLSFFTFYPKSEKPIKAVIRHLPAITPAEDIAEGLTDLGFDVVSVKQMSSTRKSPTPITLPLFLVTLPRTAKSQEMFKLTSLCHISIKVEAYKTTNVLTQCYNCQQFGHVWANCKQPPRCLWCGGSGVETVRRRTTHLQYPHAVTASWRKEKRHIPPTTAAAGMLRKKCPRRRNHRKHRKTKLEGCSFPTSLNQMYLSLQLSETRLNNRGNRRKSQAVQSHRSSDARKQISQFRLPV